MTCTKKRKICTCCWVSEAKIYLYHSNKIANAGSGYDEITQKLWKSSKMKFFENSFNMDKLVSQSIRNTMYKKKHKICDWCRVSKVNIFWYSSCKIAKAGPGYAFWPYSSDKF